jgi:hypothetical protein
MVDWNYGPGEPLVPLLVSESTESTEASVDRLLNAVDKGAITMDSDLQAWLRELLGAPQAARPIPGEPPRLVPAAARHAHRRRPAAAATVGEVRLPSRVLRRDPLPFEALAAVDFAGIEAGYEDGIQRLLAEWSAVKASQIDELAGQIAVASTEDALVSVQASALGADVLTDELLAAVEAGARHAVQEAAAQGVSLDMPDVAAMRDRLAGRAQAIATVLSRSLSEAAGRQALARAGGTLTTAEIADQVRGHLESLSDAYLVDQFTGVISQGMNTGRRTVIATASPERIYASALLDANACDVCVEWDGHEWDTLDEAEQQFPSGGNSGCLGGPRCRCTLVAQYAESEPTVQ